MIKGQIQWLESTRKTKTKTGVLRKFREAKFLDTTGDIDLAVWGSVLTSIMKHNVTYELTNVTTTIYGKKFKLQTSGTTSVEASKEQDQLDWKNADLRDNILLIDPDVVSVYVDSFLNMLIPF